jgi:hypothetical protein
MYCCCLFLLLLLLLFHCPHSPGGLFCATATDRSDSHCHHGSANPGSAGISISLILGSYCNGSLQLPTHTMHAAYT